MPGPALVCQILAERGGRILSLSPALAHVLFYLLSHCFSERASWVTKVRGHPSKTSKCCLMLFSLLIGQEEKTTKNKCASKVYSKLSSASPSPLSFFQQRRSQREPNAKTPAGCWNNFVICYLYKNQEIFKVGESLCYAIVIYFFFLTEKRRGLKTLTEQSRLKGSLLRFTLLD